MKETLGACFCVAVGGLAGLAGCVIEPGPAVPIGVAVSGPPPAPVIEMRPPPPTVRAVWIAGYWHWTGMQYAWIPGHWEEAHEGVQWWAPSYPMRDGTYFYEPGRWSRPRG
ncbi:MAG: hypothetical protein M3O50_10850 [Myxococcota bacterium]|nr:hypothetical protein [Myxococcota bacterium]